MFSIKKLLIIFVVVFIVVISFNYGEGFSLKPKVESKSNSLGFYNKNIELDDDKSHKVNVLSDVSEEDYIVECEEEKLILGDAYFEAQQQYFNSLSLSSSQKGQLEYVLYANLQNDESRLSLLLEYNEKFPNNSLVLTEIVSFCANNSSHYCNKSFIYSAIASDKDNGAMWFNSVLYFASKGDDEGVYDSVDGLKKTTVYNEKWGERIKLYAQALAGSHATDFYNNVISGIGIEAARAVGMSHIINWCKKGIEDTKKVNVCLQLGRNLEQRGKTSLSQLFGISIQKLIFEVEENIESYKVVDIKSKNISETLVSQKYQKAFSLMSYDEKSLRHWLDNIDLIGEVESANVLVEEAILISQIKGVALCTN